MITVRSAILVGIESRPVTITAEESMSPGGIMITGLSAPAMRETRVRVRSALAQCCGIETGDVDITITPEVNYATGLDLPIALAVAQTARTIRALTDGDTTDAEVRACRISLGFEAIERLIKSASCPHCGTIHDPDLALSFRLLQEGWNALAEESKASRAALREVRNEVARIKDAHFKDAFNKEGS